MKYTKIDENRGLLERSFKGDPDYPPKTKEAWAVACDFQQPENIRFVDHMGLADQCFVSFNADVMA